MTRDVAAGDYAVGRGKPPVHTRFQPGQSGNPRGRPKGSKNFYTLMDEALSERVTVTENGKRRSLTKKEIIVRQLTNKAAAGDSKSTALLLRHLASQQAAPTERDAEPIFGGADDNQVLIDMLERFRSPAPTQGEDA